MDFKELRDVFAALLGNDERPVVAFSGLYSLASALPGPMSDLPDKILEVLRDAAGPKRTLLMPCFTNGFVDGALDLDHTPGNTGMVNEKLRLAPGAKRTASAFFSFAALGPLAEEAARLRPADAWGDGSLYEWIERMDARALTIGVPRTQCSFLHRLEWVRRERIPYRYVKEFRGVIRRNGREEALTERLFVRDLEVNVVNTWEPYVPLLEENGMRSVPVGMGHVAAMDARAMMGALLPVLDRDPYAFVKDADLLRSHYAARDAAKIKSVFPPSGKH